ncbi:MAG: hypothetical protein HQK65_22905, partial [Desulfamplus sp.]|nr:hypothetical protein [Desulfamplus sp.]
LTLIQHNSQGAMYEEVSFYDSFKDNAFTQLVMLTWSKVAPHIRRSKQSIGIPTYPHSAFGHLYFSGRDGEGHTGKVNLKFDETAEGGYIWETMGNNLGDNFFSEHATTLNYEIPIYNGDRSNTAEVTLWIELSEDNPSAGSGNSISISKNVSVSSTGTSTVNGFMDLSSIKKSLESQSSFTLYIGLLDTKTMASTTDVILEKITLGPPSDDVEPPSLAIVSTFDSSYDENYDRWGIGSMAPGYASDWFQAKDVADYKLSGGNPGGHLSWVGDQRDWWFFTTYSSKYRGDRSFALGKKLTFDLKTDNTKTGDSFLIPIVVLSGKNASGNDMHIFQLQSDHPEPEATWRSYSISLDGASGWKMSTKSSLTSYVDATDDNVRQVLSTLTSLRIRGEYGSYRATGGLDNVVLGAQ